MARGRIAGLPCPARGGAPMQFSHLHYLPLPYPFFSILVGIFLLLLVLLQIGALRYAYMRLGISSRAALLLLFGSLIGSYFNIPVAELPEQRIAPGQEITFYGMRYVVPVIVVWPEPPMNVSLPVPPCMTTEPVPPTNSVQCSPPTSVALPLSTCAS